jgi:hypothetical protein
LPAAFPAWRSSRRSRCSGSRHARFCTAKRWRNCARIPPPPTCRSAAPDRTPRADSAWRAQKHRPRRPAPIPALETPIADITQIAAVLRSRFGYETRLVKDAGKAQIIDALNALAADTRPDDSVLLFYAGHGYLLDDVKMGYWIPVDASVKTAKGWISNSDISRLLAAIPSRQLMLISDSCYSGTLTSERKVTQGRDLPPEQILQQRSVLVLSSGADEPVSDEGKEGHSIFAWNLIKTLQSAGGLTPGAQVWSKVSKGVTAEYPQQPQYGAVVSAGHTEGGDFLFRTP